jgi:hypothetical protein
LREIFLGWQPMKLCCVRVVVPEILADVHGGSPSK